MKVWPLFLLAACAPLTPNVVLVTLDGIRRHEIFEGADEKLMDKKAGKVEDLEALKAAFWRETPEARREAIMPFLWGTVAKQGQIFRNATVTNGKYFSYPGYNELLTGAPDPQIDSNEKKPNANVTVLEWLNGRPRFRDRVAAFSSWGVHSFIINRERTGRLINSGAEPFAGDGLQFLNRLVAETRTPWHDMRFDSFTFYGALEYVKEHRPRVLYLAFGEGDEWAHMGRYDLYLQSSRLADDYIRRLWETLQSMSQYRGKTSLVITTDHGRADPDWKGHPREPTGSQNIWIGVMSPDTPPLGIREDAVTQSQVAATVAALVGEDYNAAFPDSAKPLSNSPVRE